MNMNFLNKFKLLKFEVFLTEDFINIINNPDIRIHKVSLNELSKMIQIMHVNFVRLMALRKSVKDSNKYSYFYNTESKIDDINIPSDIVLPQFKSLSFNKVKILDEVIRSLMLCIKLAHDELSVDRHKRIAHQNSLITGFVDGSSKGFPLNFNFIRDRVDLDKNPVLYSHSFLNKSGNEEHSWLDERCIVSKFSKLSFVRDKNKEQSLLKLILTNNLMDIDSTDRNKNILRYNLEHEMMLNTNEYLSGASSLFTTGWNKLIVNLGKMIDNLLYDNFYNKLVKRMKVNSVFLIIGSTDKNFKGLPMFNKLYHKLSGEYLFSLNILTLEDFCTLYSSLMYEMKFIKNFKLNHPRATYLNPNYKLDWTLDMDLNKTLFLRYLSSMIDFDNSIYCFSGTNWTNVRVKLLEYGIDINKGESIRRNILNSNEFDLSLFLDHLLPNSKKDVVSSFSNSNTDFYKNININKTGINSYNPNTLIDMLSNHLLQLNAISSKSTNNLMSYSDLEKQFIHLNRIIFNNVYVTDNLLYSIIYRYIRLNRDNGDLLSKLDFDSKARPGINRQIITIKNIVRSYSSHAQNLSGLDKQNYYNKLEDILNEGINDPYETQRQIEKEWMEILSNDINKEKNFLRAKTSSIISRAVESTRTDDFQRIMNKLVGDLSYYFINNKFVLHSLIEIVESYKTSRRTNIAKNIGYNLMKELYIDICNNKVSALSNIHETVKNLGLNDFIELIAYHVTPKNKITVLELLSPNSKYLFHYFDSKENLEELIVFRNKANDFKITLGIRFIELFTTRPNTVFIEESESGLGGTEFLKLTLSEEYKDLLSDFEKLILRPKNLPMVCPPLKWGENEYGGFLENKTIREDIITGSVKYNAHKYLNRTKLYNTINYFNNIQFGINNNLLNYILNEGKYLIDNLDEETKFNSNISLKIANIFKNIPFYLNTHADWRGRLYTHCFYITYQGSELSSALLEFKKGERLTEVGLKIFYAYGASLYSSDNNNNTEEIRVSWIIKNMNNILNMDQEFIKKAESPISFAAFCLEIGNLEKIENYKIKMPVFIDATCSGIQHISALIGDVELAKKVNLIRDLKNLNDTPEDFYLSLVEPLNKAINDFGKSNPEYNALTELHLTRKILKQPIMTLNYNVSVFGMKEQLFNKLKVEIKPENNLESQTNFKKSITKIIGYTKDNRPINLTNKDLIQVAMIIKEVIFIQYPALKTIYDYFIDVSILMKKLGLAIEWVTPTGAVITQSYLRREKTRLTIRSNRKIKTIVLYKQTNKIDHSKQTDGIIPNVIHSLDSSHIINFINDSSKNVNFDILTVHDCFGTHPNHINDLFFFLKEEFISLYINDDFLKKFDKNIIKTIRNHFNDNIEIENRVLTMSIPVKNKIKTLHFDLPKPPKRKDLNYDFIRFSKWMFN